MTLLLVALTGHGYGHAAQTAPVVAALRARVPGLRLAVRSDLDPAILGSFLPGAEAVTRPEGDFGMAMRSAFEVDPDRTAARYAALHADYAGVIARESAAQAALAPDLVLVNGGYVGLAAARAAGLTAAGLCSLNWLATYRAFCGDRPEAPAILADMTTGYGSAAVFMTPTPSMPMPEFPTRPIGPVSRRGQNRRDALARQLGLGRGDRLLLLSLGGIATALPLEHWPRFPRGRIVVAGTEPPPRADMVSLAALGVSHLDCVASADVLITKPGYGSVVEAAVHGTPILYARRGDWPEEPAVVAWLQATATAQELAREALESGDLGPAVDRLLAAPRRPPVAPTGAMEAAELLESLL